MPAHAATTVEDVLATLALPEVRTYADAARILGVSVDTVSRYAKRGGVVQTRGRAIDPARLVRLEAMLDEGLSFAEIHRTEGADMETLRRYFPGRQWTTAQRVEFQRTLRAWDAVDAAPYAVSTRDASRASAFNRRSSSERHAA